MCTSFFYRSLVEKSKNRSWNLLSNMSDILSPTFSSSFLYTLFIESYGFHHLKYLGVVAFGRVPSVRGIGARMDFNLANLTNASCFDHTQAFSKMFRLLTTTKKWKKDNNRILERGHRLKLRFIILLQTRILKSLGYDERIQTQNAWFWKKNS